MILKVYMKIVFFPFCLFSCFYCYLFIYLLLWFICTTEDTTKIGTHVDKTVYFLNFKFQLIMIRSCMLAINRIDVLSINFFLKKNVYMFHLLRSNIKFLSLILRTVRIW